MMWRERWEGPRGNREEERRARRVRAIHQISSSGLGISLVWRVKVVGLTRSMSRLPVGDSGHSRSLDSAHQIVLFLVEIADVRGMLDSRSMLSTLAHSPRTE